MNTNTDEVTTAQVAQSLRQLADLLDSGDLGQTGDALVKRLTRHGLQTSCFDAKRMARAAVDLEAPAVAVDRGDTVDLEITTTVGVVPVRVSGPASIVGERRVVGTETVERVEWVLAETAEVAS